jgi:hypothetical protein
MAQPVRISKSRFSLPNGLDKAPVYFSDLAKRGEQ